MTISCSWGALPHTGLLITASCAICRSTCRALADTPEEAARTGFDHRCGTGIVGPLWTLIQPPAGRTRHPRPSVENAA